MDHLSDTNVVGRWVLPEDRLYLQMRQTTRILRQRGDSLFITPQNIIEFRAFATRPLEVNGLGMTSHQVDHEVANLEASFPLLPDTPDIYPLWRHLVETYGVTGRQVHDARLVAVMPAHGVSRLLTMNPVHFRKFREIGVVTPEEVVSTSEG